jgi:ATP-dependent DNA helicase RecG
LSGTQQSGVLELKLANLATDQGLLQHARETVITILAEDPELKDPKNSLLMNYLAKRARGITLDKIS